MSKPVVLILDDKPDLHPAALGRMDLDTRTAAPMPTYVCGESGTGTELVARPMHHGGVRADGTEPPHPGASR